MGLLVAFHDAHGIAPLDPDAVIDTVGRALLEKLLWVAEDDGEIVGVLGISEGPIWYSPRYVALADRFYYVTPDRRASRVGKALADAATVEAKRRDLPLLLHVFNPERMRKRGRIASIEGFIPVGEVVRLA